MKQNKLLAVAMVVLCIVIVIGVISTDKNHTNEADETPSIPIENSTEDFIKNVPDTMDKTSEVENEPSEQNTEQDDETLEAILDDTLNNTLIENNDSAIDSENSPASENKPMDVPRDADNNTSSNSNNPTTSTTHEITTDDTTNNKFNLEDTNQDGVIDGEEASANINPSEQKAIDAGYGTVVLLDSGNYAVLTHGDGYVNEKHGFEILADYLAGLGLCSSNMTGGWIDDNNDWYWYIAKDAKEIDTSGLEWTDEGEIEFLD